jgi:hypothetical protein
MGITIHYTGRARSAKAIDQLIDAAQVFAVQRHWQFAMYDEPVHILDPRGEDETGSASGPYRGIIINPHPDCESIWFIFDASNELCGFTKTQFAPFQVHVEILKLLREIEPYMETFEVMDESGLWENGDEAAARDRFRFLDAAIGSFSHALRAEGLKVEGPGVPARPAVPDDDLPPRLRRQG